VAPADLVTRRALCHRADSKFVLSPTGAADLLGALTGDYAVLAAGEACLADYQTLYFDTADLDFFHARRCGRRVRHKVRIRHYPGRRLTLLEVKTRRNDLQTTKVIRPRRFGDNTLSPDDQAFVRLHTGLDRDVLPQVWTNYTRATLFGLHTNERVTVDLNLALTMGDQRRSFATVIVEVKQSPFRRSTPVMALLRDAGWRPRSVSKYCAGIVYTRRSVPCNRLLPDLRALEQGGAA